MLEHLGSRLCVGEHSRFCMIPSAGWCSAALQNSFPAGISQASVWYLKELLTQWTNTVYLTSFESTVACYQSF